MADLLAPQQPAGFGATGGANFSKMRDLPQYAHDQMAQNILGPLEHYQMQRALTAKNPVTGLVTGNPITTGVYSGLKYLFPKTMTRFGKSWPGDTTLMSQPSVEEMASAWQGTKAGLSDWWNGGMGFGAKPIQGAQQ